MGKIGENQWRKTIGSKDYVYDSQLHDKAVLALEYATE